MPKGVYIRTEETRKRMSLANRGKHLSEEHKMKIGLKSKGRVSAMKGKHHTEESKRKIKEKRKLQICKPWSEEQRKKLSGENSYLWKGGITKNKLEYLRNWYKNLSEEDKKKVSWQRNKRNRLKRMKNTDGSIHTFGEWQTLRAQYNFTCPCCGKKEPEIKLTEDHIIPLSKGGSDNIENIQPLCLKCNVTKHTKIIKF
jgi:hypothetical protein